MQEGVLCWEASDIKAGIEDGECSPMTDIQVLDRKMRGGKGRIEGRPEDRCTSKVEEEGRDGEQEKVVEVNVDDCKLKWDNW